MNIQIREGNRVSTGKGGIMINGELIKNTPKNMTGRCQSMINGNIYIDGYEYFKDEKKFKRTFKAIWYLIFW